MRPAAVAPRSSAGRVRSRSDRRELTGWTRNPSATRPATSVICGPNPAVKIGGSPYRFGPGEKAGIMRVCV